MKIEPRFLINSESAKIAWEFSRPNIDFEGTMEELQNIIKLDLPVNEFPVFHLEIECTIAEREIFTSMRNHVVWARTSRVDNVIEFEIDYVSESHRDYSEVYEERRARMKQDSTTERQDDWRMRLPIMAKTKFSCLINARDLTKLGKYFDHLSFAVTNNHYKMLFKKASDEIFYILKYAGYDKELTNNYKIPKILCEDFSPHYSEDSYFSQDFAIISGKLPFSLRAQLVRHRNIMFRDNLFNLFFDDMGHLADLSTTINITIAGQVSDLEHIYSKRSCWIAQYNLWSDLLNKFFSIPNFKARLPCDDGSCPFSEDAMARVQNKDPNPPCPIHARIYNQSLTQDQLINMHRMVNSDGRPIFWADEISNYSLINSF